MDEGEGTTLDESGQTGTLAQLVDEFPLREPSTIASVHSAGILAQLQERWDRSPGWISRTTKRDRAFFDPVIAKHRISVSFAQVVPHYCGWRRYRKRNHQVWRRYSYFLDPDIFYGSEKAVLDVFGVPRNITAQKLLDWAQAVRTFCEENDLPPKQTQGSLAAQFLTDKRFYPELRRKVPKATNAHLRRYMPGNHSFVTVSTNRDTRFNALYLDQRRAHHYHAGSTRLPASDSLFAYGDFARLKHLSLDPSAFLNGSFYGCVAGNFTPPQRGTAFLPPGWRRRSVSRRLVSTAEWPWLSNIGVECTGLYAAWGSAEADVGIPAYSRHAGSELDRWADRPMGNSWVKPILVATYGALALNLETMRFDTMIGGPLPEGKSQETWDVGGAQTLHGYLLRNTNRNKVEPGCVNVLHRLMIESATRTESLSYANYLQHRGYWVLMIHVDAVIVEDRDGDSLPPVIDPWRCKTRLTGVRFYDNCSFESYELTRLPGRPLTDRTMRSPKPLKLEAGFLEPVPG